MKNPESMQRYRRRGLHVQRAANRPAPLQCENRPKGNQPWSNQQPEKDARTARPWVNLGKTARVQAQRYNNSGSAVGGNNVNRKRDY
ncbi:MAG: hypothetical protein AMXMBFR84_39340 [Candidatus Hydrogenedentota bacterium]